MRGWIFVGLITGVIFGGAAALVAWIFAMPLGITVRVVALAVPLGIAVEWLAVRARGLQYPFAFATIIGLAVALFVQARAVSPGPRFVTPAEQPVIRSATEPPAGAEVGRSVGVGGTARTGAAARPRADARVVEAGRASRDDDRERATVPDAPATLMIRNPTKATLRLWIVDSGGRSRLGRLRAGRTREVSVRVREPSVVIEVRGRGGGYVMPVGVAPGATIDIALVPTS